MRTIKSATGDELMRDEDIWERWGQYFSWLMNEENPRLETEEREPNQGLTAPINEAETERALKGMKSGKAVGSDEIPAGVWKCLEWFGVVTLCKLFNSIMITVKPLARNGKLKKKNAVINIFFTVTSKMTQLHIFRGLWFRLA